MKLVFAAPASGLPFLSTAFGAQASALHFFRKEFFAAPASGLPSALTALSERRTAKSEERECGDESDAFHDVSPLTGSRAIMADST